MSNKLGKIEYPFFNEIIKENSGLKRKEVIVGPQFGVDVSLIQLPGDQVMALTSDPLSLIPSLGLAESAWLSVHLMTNDMATTGHAPMYGQFVLNLPAAFSKTDFAEYWNHIHQYCSQIGMSITGGHTGFIEGQNSTIAGGGTFITIGDNCNMLTSRDAQPGDSILVTKQSALSSSAILAMSFPETVKNKAGIEVYQKGCEAFYLTSSLLDAKLAVGSNNCNKDITAMHDVTEGGVLGAIYELAMASGNGAIIQNEAIPSGEVQNAICKIFNLDTRYCIGAGSMIITCKPGTSEAVIKRLSDNNILCTKVGRITDKNKGIKLVENGIEADLPYHFTDPYWAAFFTALNSGWK